MFCGKTSPNKLHGLQESALPFHYNGVIMGAMASQINRLTIVYSTVYSKRRSKKTSKLRVTGLCAGNSSVTGEFPAQRASNAENVSIWWLDHAFSGTQPTHMKCCPFRYQCALSLKSLNAVLPDKDHKPWRISLQFADCIRICVLCCWDFAVVEIKQFEFELFE